MSTHPPHAVRLESLHSTAAGGSSSAAHAAAADRPSDEETGSRRLSDNATEALTQAAKQARTRVGLREYVKRTVLFGLLFLLAVGVILAIAFAVVVADVYHMKPESDGVQVDGSVTAKTLHVDSLEMDKGSSQIESPTDLLIGSEGSTMLTSKTRMSLRSLEGVEISTFAASKETAETAATTTSTKSGESGNAVDIRTNCLFVTANETVRISDEATNTQLLVEPAQDRISASAPASVTVQSDQLVLVDAANVTLSGSSGQLTLSGDGAELQSDGDLSASAPAGAISLSSSAEVTVDSSSFAVTTNAGDTVLQVGASSVQLSTTASGGTATVSSSQGAAQVSGATASVSASGASLSLDGTAATLSTTDADGAVMITSALDEVRVFAEQRVMLTSNTSTVTLTGQDAALTLDAAATLSAANSLSLTSGSSSLEIDNTDITVSTTASGGVVALSSPQGEITATAQEGIAISSSTLVNLTDGASHVLLADSNVTASAPAGGIAITAQDDISATSDSSVALHSGDHSISASASTGAAISSSKTTVSTDDDSSDFGAGAVQSSSDYVLGSSGTTLQFANSADADFDSMHLGDTVRISGTVTSSALAVSTKLSPSGSVVSVNLDWLVADALDTEPWRALPIDGSGDDEMDLTPIVANSDYSVVLTEPPMFALRADGGAGAPVSPVAAVRKTALAVDSSLRDASSAPEDANTILAFERDNVDLTTVFTEAAANPDLLFTAELYCPAENAPCGSFGSEGAVSGELPFVALHNAPFSSDLETDSNNANASGIELAGQFGSSLTGAHTGYDAANWRVLYSDSAFFANARWRIVIDAENSIFVDRNNTAFVFGSSETCFQVATFDACSNLGYAGGSTIQIPNTGFNPTAFGGAFELAYIIRDEWSENILCVAEGSEDGGTLPDEAQTVCTKQTPGEDARVFTDASPPYNTSWVFVHDRIGVPVGDSLTTGTRDRNYAQLELDLNQDGGGDADVYGAQMYTFGLWDNHADAGGAAETQFAVTLTVAGQTGTTPTPPGGAEHIAVTPAASDSAETVARLIARALNTNAAFKAVGFAASNRGTTPPDDFTGHPLPKVIIYASFTGTVSAPTLTVGPMENTVVTRGEPSSDGSVPLQSEASAALDLSSAGLFVRLRRYARVVADVTAGADGAVIRQGHASVPAGAVDSATAMAIVLPAAFGDAATVSSAVGDAENPVYAQLSRASDDQTVSVRRRVLAVTTGSGGAFDGQTILILDGVFQGTFNAADDTSSVDLSSHKIQIVTAHTPDVHIVNATAFDSGTKVLQLDGVASDAFLPTGSTVALRYPTSSSHVIIARDGGSKQVTFDTAVPAALRTAAIGDLQYAHRPAAGLVVSHNQQLVSIVSKDTTWQAHRSIYYGGLIESTVVTAGSVSALPVSQTAVAASVSAPHSTGTFDDSNGRLVLNQAGVFKITATATLAADSGTSNGARLRLARTAALGVFEGTTLHQAPLLVPAGFPVSATVFAVSAFAAGDQIQLSVDVDTGAQPVTVSSLSLLVEQL